MRIGVGPLLEKFEDVQRIAVLRGGGLGDLLFAYPALDALAHAYPEAELTLLCTPMHAALLRDRPGPVDRIEELPFAEGVRPGPEDAAAVEGFIERMRARGFDLAVQLHGGGRYSNPFLLRLGARHTVGTRTPDAEPLERNLPYIYYQNEFQRGLEVVGLAGAEPVSLEPRFAATPEELAAGERLAGLKDRPLVVMHPGATDPRRRWPTSSFAEVASMAVADGHDVVLVGDDGDARLATEILGRADGIAVSSGRIRSLAGELSLPELVGVLSAASVVVGNDSGPRHLAQAVGTPTVGIFWAGNVISAGAIGRMLHRIHIAWLIECPVCGVDVTQVGWTAERCEHNDSFVQQVQPEAVYADVRALAAERSSGLTAGLTARSPLLHGR